MVEAGRQARQRAVAAAPHRVDDALDAGKVPVLLAGTCSICLTTLPIVMRRHPDAFVLWLDAHADFNTPQTTASDLLGGPRASIFRSFMMPPLWRGRERRLCAARDDSSPAATGLWVAPGVAWAW